MQNENERKGLKDLLGRFNVGDLRQLLGTVTQNMIKLGATNKEEIIDAIIQHSPSTNSILQRKLVTCRTLFSYLHENSVSVHPPVTKCNLIELVTAYWSRKIVENTNETNNIVERIELNHFQTSNDNSTVVQTEDANTLNFPINIMARTFSEWFYEMFNKNGGLTANHLWPDCSLRLHLKSNENILTQEVLNTADGVVRLLEDTKKEHNLFFNPNISHEGVQGRMDAYGQILIVSCGTLHKDNLCVGIFQQMCALVRDPLSSNNWKIKNLELKLQSRSVTATPSLQETDYRENILSLPEYDGGV